MEKEEILYEIQKAMSYMILETEKSENIGIAYQKLKSILEGENHQYIEGYDHL